MCTRKKFFPSKASRRYAARAMSASESDSPNGGDPASWVAPAGWLQSLNCRLSSYLPLEGLLRGRRVLDVKGLPAGVERVRAAGARAVLAVQGPPWPVPDRSVDAVLALGAWQEPEGALLAEARRVLAPGGFLAWRFERAGSATRGAVAARLSQTFASVEVLGQVPVAGFCLDRSGSASVVVAEDLFPSGAEPSHLLALACAEAERPWAALESWVLPLARPDVAAVAPSAEAPASVAALEKRIGELTYEREYLREALMTLQDERERLERLAHNLRRDADRNLARISEQAAALEVLSLERDHALRRLAAGEADRGPQRPLEGGAGALDELRKSTPTSA